MKKVPLVLAVAVALAVAGCSSGSKGNDTSGGGKLTVLAASSLTGTFQTLATTFEKQHPGVKVVFSFDSSATLAEQVNQGAPADVLATADTKTMQTVVDAKSNDGAPQLFATNVLVLALPKANPAGITSFGDLNKPSVGWIMCVTTAPCGSLAQTELAANHITTKPESQEVDVKSVLAKIDSGDVDAGLVYATDAKADASNVTPLPIPHTAQFVNKYPIVALNSSKESALAHDWVTLVLSSKGQQVLEAAGFGTP
ncbi:MAG: molybdate ABC transporter substrate-binding protein [Nocardioidaceae bacterium]